MRTLKIDRLKGLAVYFRNDLYEFAHLKLRLIRAKEAQQADRSRSYPTLKGLARSFAEMLDAVHPDEAAVLRVIERAGLPLGAALDEEEGPRMGVAEAVQDVIDILRARAARGGDGQDPWARMVKMIAKDGTLPGNEGTAIEEAVADACRGWTESQRRSIWHETESGMADAKSLGDTSSEDIGYELQSEMLGEVTRAAGEEAEELKKATEKRAVRRKGSPSGEQRHVRAKTDERSGS